MAYSVTTTKGPWKYRGWIPSARGRISYTRFGVCDSPFPATSVNYGDSNDRIIISSQKRYLGDYWRSTNFFLKVLVFLKIRRPTSTRLRPLEGTYHFVCIAKTTDRVPFGDNPLKGFVFYYNRNFKYWRSIELIVRGFLSELGQIKIDGKVIPNSLKKVIDSFILFLKSNGIFAEFHLERSGETTVTLFSQHVVDFSTIDGVANQCFYFLKDIAHRHQHHNPRDDALVRMHLMDAGGTWRHRTLQSLHGTILEARNFRTRLNVCVDALGIIEYARVFCRMHGKIFPYFNDDTLAGSLAAKIENLKLEGEHRARRRTYFMYSVELISIFVAFLITIFYFVWIRLPRHLHKLR